MMDHDHKLNSITLSRYGRGYVNKDSFGITKWLVQGGIYRADNTASTIMNTKITARLDITFWNNYLAQAIQGHDTFTLGWVRYQKMN